MNPIQQVATQLRSEDECIHMSLVAEDGVRPGATLVSIDSGHGGTKAASAQAEARAATSADEPSAVGTSSTFGSGD